MALDFQTPVQGYNPLRFNPQMPLAQTSPGLDMSSIYPGQINPSQNKGASAPASGSNYTMQPSWQFGLNWQQIQASNMVKGIGAYLRNNNERADAKSYQRVQQNPLLQLPENPNNSQQSLYGMKTMKKGGKVKMAEGGKFDDYDDFDEEDFQDLKGELDKYFADKQAIPEADKQELKEQTEDKEESQEEKPDEDTPPSSKAMEFLMSEDKPEASTPEETSGSANVSAGQSAADVGSEQPHPSVYAQKPTDDVAAFKSGIARVENAGYTEGNKNSSAFGKYQFTAPTRENVREQFFSTISKKDFETSYKEDPKFQERVMDVYGSHLLQTYGDPHKAALAFYLGPGGVKYQNQPDYNPGHGNVSVGKYLSTFDQGYGKRQGGHISIQPETIQTNFEEGGEYELTDMQIANLKKQGYKIQIVK